MASRSLEPHGQALLLGASEHELKLDGDSYVVQQRRC